MAIEKAPRRSFTFSYGIFAFLFLVANLRPALTAVGPVVDDIRTSLGLSAAAAGLLAALPLLIFAGCSPLAGLARVFGLERILAGCLAVTAAGIALRSAGTAAALFGGTMILAAGIGVANVLVPSLIKRDFPLRIESMTTAYLMTMSLTAAVATGLAAPLAQRLAGGWRWSLAVWAVFAAVALLCWLPEVRKGGDAAAKQQPDVAAPLWRSGLAWLITVYMGLQSLIYYVVLAWMPAYLADHGTSPAEAGFLLMLFQAVGFGVGFAAPPLLRRSPDHRLLAAATSLCAALAILGLMLAPRFAGLWLAVFGASLGITFILAFALIGLRTRDYRQAASLSTMALAAGYLIAATGPVAFGWLHDLTAGWMVPMAGLLAVTVGEAVVGLGAGRRGYV